MKKYVKAIILGITAVILWALFFRKENEEKINIRSYDEIIQSGILKAVTEYNSLSFYVDGDSVAGFHYELLKAFAKDKGIALEVTPLMSMDERMKGMENGSFDILANNVLITTGRKDSLKFTRPIILSKQVLVQRKPMQEGDSTYITNLLDLAGKTVYIVKGSPYKLRIQNLSNEIGDTIYVEEVEKYGPEQLLAMVSHGDIDYAVCDNNIAQTLQENFPRLDMSKDISFTQFYSWGVNPENTILLDTLNAWLDSYMQTPAFQLLKKKYYKN